MAHEVLVSLLTAGLKATRIAQACRERKQLFEILVQEKGKLRNNVADFKTLADVFIQQVAKTELEKKIPSLGERVFGEENNEFTNTLGESIVVEVKPTMEETCNLLAKVLDGNHVAARLLAVEAHSNVEDQIEKIDKETAEKLSMCEVDIDNIAVWIDPIDGTAQYVGGIYKEAKDKHGVHGRGLQCVTVLIGMYNIQTGLPIMGVVCQPFYENVEGSWKSRCFWGVCCNDVRVSNVKSLHEKNVLNRSGDLNCTVITSPHDKQAYRVVASCDGVEHCTGGGAGYKCLCVIEGLVDGYLYTGDACYKWDTCATHAILSSLGGSIVNLTQAQVTAAACRDTTETKFNPQETLKHLQLLYNTPNPHPSSPWANIGGILAFGPSNKSSCCVKHVLMAMEQS
uniref:inositol polyphosphate 1-phosphatase-like n=1 Tax=Ciona intestinalis TaxID=7719 RepID=UPI000180BF70|nr:inositol polyphosphate 1-phosphatase-like [Ciona intestinalis]|eukprot:XP_002131415.1 inositol polyphosphate 1-phosphatase-like [Ciona intestinalis]